MGQGDEGGFTMFEAQNLQELKLVAEEAAATLACAVFESGQECCCLNVLGLRLNGQNIGNWAVTVERQGNGVYH